MSGHLPFDTVVVQEEQGTATFSVDEFLALPFSDRVRAILGNSLQFFRAGAPVDRADALRALRIRQADAG